MNVKAKMIDWSYEVVVISELVMYILVIDLFRYGLYSSRSV